MLRIINEDHEGLILILMSDEAHFHVTGFMNKQNMRLLGTSQSYRIE
jgi:hypothetical protein